MKSVVLRTVVGVVVSMSKVGLGLGLVCRLGGGG